jgi:lipopolysaccharide/colanic/teichoic acid biosynthesis glycosyltransferase
MYKHFLKRCIDFMVALTAVIALIPVFLILIILLKITGHKRVFFLQKRVGLHERVFTLFKFRSMTETTDKAGNLLPDSERLTSFGKMLRKTSLDELPQLINVLLGQMSLIGPRPLLVEYLKYYDEEQKKRHLVRPGITGWAQVNGRNAISWEKKFELDVWYVQQLSFGLDLSIIWKTVQKIIQSEGISQDGQATMEAFRGGKK